MCALAGLQKCEVAQRPRVENGAEHRSTPHLCQLNIRRQMWSSTFVSDATFQRISIKHSIFNPDSVIEASFEVLSSVPDIMNKVQLFQDRTLTDAERLALAMGAATYRWEILARPSSTLRCSLIRDALETEQEIFGSP
jgi:hypothetical protein